MMIITIYQFYCVQERVAFPVIENYYYNYHTTKYSKYPSSRHTKTLFYDLLLTHNRFEKHTINMIT